MLDYHSWLEYIIFINQHQSFNESFNQQDMEKVSKKEKEVKYRISKKPRRNNKEQDVMCNAHCFVMQCKCKCSQCALLVLAEVRLDHRTKSNQIKSKSLGRYLFPSWPSVNDRDGYIWHGQTWRKRCCGIYNLVHIFISFKAFILIIIFFLLFFFLMLGVWDAKHPSTWTWPDTGP